MGDKIPGDATPASLVSKFVRACLMVLVGVFALWLALQVLGQIWGWLLLIATTIGLIWAVFRFIRWRRDGRW